MSSRINGLASDVYGGITNNTITDNYGHYPDNLGDPYNYWYDDNGNATGAQNREFFADNFAVNVTGYQAPSESALKYFPTATVSMEELIGNAAGKIR